nr:PAS domain S-box protein [uncultured Desulfobacter sp.]
MTASNTKLNVLIVEDSEDDALLIVRELKRGGYRPEWRRVETPETFAAELHEQKWDIILSDCRMPHFDASTALALLQDTGQDVPFIVISGVIGEETAVALMKAGASDFLFKGALVRLVPAVRRELKEAENRQRHILAEKALYTERERLKMIILGSRLGTWVWDLQTNEIVLNEQWAAMLGYTLEELAPSSYETLTGLIHPEDFGPATERMEKYLRDETPEYECELRLRHKDGSWVWVMDRARIMKRDAQGRPQAMFGTHLEISKRKQFEEKLSASEQRFRALFEQAGDYCMVLDPNTPDGIPIIVDANKAACTMHGYTREEFIGRKVTDVDDTDGRQFCLERTQQIMTGKPFFVENTHVRKDGSTFDAAIHANRIDIEGHPPLIFTTEYDITSRKRAEKAMRTAHERLEVAVAGGALGTWEWLPLEGEHKKPTGTLVFNEYFLTMLGYVPGEIEYNLEAVHALIDPEALPGMYKLMRAHLNGETPYYEAVYRMRHKSGDWVYIHDRGQVTERYNTGFPKRVCGTHADITRLMQAEKKLRKSEAKFRSYVEQAPSGVFILDATGRYVDVNPAASEITGYSRDELLEMRLGDLTPPDAQTNLAVRFARLCEQGHGEDVFSCVKKNGTRCLLNITAVRLDKDRFLGFARDITKQQRLEEQLRQAQKMESVGRLAGGVAHDFNNMLSVINGYSSLLLESLQPDDPLYEDVTEILNAGKRSADITRQLLAFARQQAITPQVIDLNATIEGMLKMLRRLIGEEIELAWLPGIKIRPVKIDPAQVDQILANLCVNAKDAISNVGRITIETKNIDFDEAASAMYTGLVPGAYVMLAVSDSGSGIPPNILDQIFEPFFTTKGRHQGTGLGLSTVYGIVKQNHGYITAYSELEQGATFKCYFPVHENIDEKKRRESDQRIPLGNGECILVVEDDKSITKFCIRILKKLGYTILSASTPGEALQTAQKHKEKIDLLLTDVIMPEMNGRELAEMLQGIIPNLRILYMSGYPADVIGNKGVLEEGVLLIQKPLSSQTMAVKIREALR